MIADQSASDALAKELLAADLKREAEKIKAEADNLAAAKAMDASDAAASAAAKEEQIKQDRACAAEMERAPPLSPSNADFCSSAALAAQKRAEQRSAAASAAEQRANAQLSPAALDEAATFALSDTSQANLDAIAILSEKQRGKAKSVQQTEPAAPTMDDESFPKLSAMAERRRAGEVARKSTKDAEQHFGESA